MHDLRAIRENPQAFDAAMKRRKLPPQSPDILRMDEERRAAQTQLQGLQNERNTKSKEIGDVKRSGGDATTLMMEVANLKTLMTELEEKERMLGESLNLHLSSLPNILFDDVPDGADENDNVEVRRVGEPKKQNSEAPDHVAIGEALGMMDFETAAKLSGSRFVLMHSGLARLERALAQFMLDTHTTEHGYTEVSPPLLVRDNAMYGTGQLPKFAEDLFSTGIFGPQSVKKMASDALGAVSEKYDLYSKIHNTLLTEEEKPKLELELLGALMTNDAFNSKNRLWLIPTSEVSLTNIVAEDIVDIDDLPLRMTAFTPCFRSEAGAAGKDTRGMIRQHQFYKVEMVSITAPDKSVEEHERMTACAENILKKLELPFRTIILCSSDTGFGARKTYDIEVWLPGQNKYREISSCSNCWDFQARRMNARTRAKGEKDTQFVHTLNGSGVAVGRALIAVLENYYDPADGGVFVPSALKPYMGGVEKILPIK